MLVKKYGSPSETKTHEEVGNLAGPPVITSEYIWKDEISEMKYTAKEQGKMWGEYRFETYLRKWKEQQDKADRGCQRT
jgi:hypothetical protein